MATPLLATLYDDFQLPGLDGTKWNISGSAFIYQNGTDIKQTSTQGLVLRPYVGGNLSTCTLVQSRAAASFTFNNSRATWELNEVPSGSGMESQFVVSQPGVSNVQYRFRLIQTGSSGVVSGLRLIAQLIGTSGSELTSKTVNFNFNAHKFLRLIALDSTQLIYWQTSGDGTTWSTLMTTNLYPAVAAAKVTMRCWTSSTYGFLRIRRFNTTKDIDRGTGYLYEDFKTLPLNTSWAAGSAGDPKTQWGQWLYYAGSGPNTVADMENPNSGTRNAYMSAASTSYANTRSSFVKDVDITYRVYNANGGAFRMHWKHQNIGDATYWYLETTSSGVSLGYSSGGSFTTVQTVSKSISLNTFYTFRVIHSGSSIVVYADDGQYATNYKRAVELFRVTNTFLANQVGTQAIQSVSGGQYVKDITVSAGVSPAAPVTNLPVDPSQVKPLNWNDNTVSRASQFEYFYFVDDYGNRLNILPSYGDITLRSADLGSPSARQVIKPRPLGNGAVSYTRFHTEKTISIELMAYKTANYEAQYHADLITQWCYPGNKFRIVYKPRGNAERYVNVEADDIGRPVVTALGNQKLELSLALIAVDGGDYESAESLLTLSGVGAQDILNNKGNLPTEGTIRFYGPSNNPVIFNDTVESYSGGDIKARLGLNYNIDAGDFVELDLKNRTVQSNGWDDPSASLRGFLVIRDWFVYPPRKNLLRYSSEPTDAAPGAVGYVTVSWKNKY